MPLLAQKLYPPACSRHHSAEVQSGKIGVCGESARIEIYRTRSDVGFTAVDEAADQLDHLGDVLGCAAHDVRTLDIQLGRIAEEGVLIFACDLPDREPF